MSEPIRPVIGISLGDFNGIGPEVNLKSLQGNQLCRFLTPVIYGSQRVLNRYRQLLDMKDWQLHPTPDATELNTKLTNVITCFDDSQTAIEPGRVTGQAGQAAFACLQRAVDDLKAGHLNALVTAPINKHNIQSEAFAFPGHTEYLASQFQAREVLMLMVAEGLRVGVVTGHVPLGEVQQRITTEAVSRKLTALLHSLQYDFGISRPRVALLGLNPHAGENGLLGSEENNVLIPVIEQFTKKGELVFGPYPADGFFGMQHWQKFDAVLAMYHDQGLMPFKMLAFDDGVNFTAGLPVVRTSPDHGTAYDIAGKNLADAGSMLQALYTAADIYRNRSETAEMQAERQARQAAAGPQQRIRRDDRPERGSQRPSRADRDRRQPKNQPKNQQQGPPAERQTQQTKQQAPPPAGPPDTGPQGHSPEA